MPAHAESRNLIIGRPNEGTKPGKAATVCFFPGKDTILEPFRSSGRSALSASGATGRLRAR